MSAAARRTHLAQSSSLFSCAWVRTARMSCCPQNSKRVAKEAHRLTPRARRHHRDDVEPVGVAPEVISRDEFICGRLKPLALLPIDELPGLAERTGLSRLDLYEDERFAFQRNQVQLAPAGAIAPSEDVVSEPEQVTAGDSFAESTEKQMRRGHAQNV